MPKPPPDDADRLLGHHRPEREPASPPRPPAVPRSPTRKEAIPRPPAPAHVPPAPAPPPTAPPPPPAPAAEDDALAFRPVRRPPVALLCVLDDGVDDDGEWVRLRADTFVLGRSQVDVIIPHDGLMSGRHAEITRTAEGGRFRWVLTDLGSTNGSFVKVDRALLKPGKEMLLGRTRLRFDAPVPGGAGEPPPGDARSTVGWQAVKPTDLYPSLVVLTPKEDGPRFPLTKADLTIGRDPDCEISLPDDPLASRRHARLTRDVQGVWHIAADPASRNGLWVRLTDPLPVSKTCVFLLGEQRFLLKVP